MYWPALRKTRPNHLKYSSIELVDTHVNRISKRWGYAKEEDDVLEVERKMKKSFPEESLINLHYRMVHFGRRICNSRSPKCHECELNAICKYKPTK